jgi:hypothetical protein
MLPDVVESSCVVNHRVRRLASHTFARERGGGDVGDGGDGSHDKENSGISDSEDVDTAAEWSSSSGSSPPRPRPRRRRRRRRRMYDGMWPKERRDPVTRLPYSQVICRQMFPRTSRNSSDPRPANRLYGATKRDRLFGAGADSVTSE